METQSDSGVPASCRGGVNHTHRLENKSHLPLTSMKDGRQRQTVMDTAQWRPTAERVTASEGEERQEQREGESHGTSGNGHEAQTGDKRMLRTEVTPESQGRD